MRQAQQNVPRSRKSQCERETDLAPAGILTTRGWISKEASGIMRSHGLRERGKLEAYSFAGENSVIQYMSCLERHPRSIDVVKGALQAENTGFCTASELDENVCADEPNFALVLSHNHLRTASTGEGRLRTRESPRLVYFAVDLQASSITAFTVT